MPVQAICDIVIPVHNALTQTTRCIRSVLRVSSRPFRLVIVNDASDELTSRSLRVLAETAKSCSTCLDVALIENEDNLGFLHTANRGLEFDRFEKNPGNSVFKIILNSDTVVTAGWLEKFEECFASDDTIGLATPVSNNAENLSVSIPPGFSWITMAEEVGKTDCSAGYPDVATAIGFCMGIRTSAIKSAGVFDEVFAPGYAEDSDLHYRFLSRGFRSVLIPSCFIFHESHASFSVNKERLVRRNRPIFDQRWSTIYANDLAHHNTTRPLAAVEDRLTEARSLRRKHDVLFVIPTAKLFGGIIVVYEIVHRLLERGIDANAIVLSDEVPIDMQLLFTPYFRPPATWSAPLPESQVYVATHFETCPYVHEAVARCAGAKPAYLVQGYEAWFPGASIEEVVHTYKSIPLRTCVSKWVSQMLSRWDCDSRTIPNGVDTTFFYPEKPSQLGTVRSTSRPLTVITQLREDPQAGWKLAGAVLKRIRALHADIRIIGVGNLVDHPDLAPLLSERYAHADRKTMRTLYRQADVFLDCSMVQGFGLMGLEAMASGLAVVTGTTGGVTEYATSQNSMMVDLGDESGFVDALVKLYHEPKTLAALQHQGFLTAQAFDWDVAADSYADFFRHCIFEAPEVSVDNVREMVRYLFGRLVRSEEAGRTTLAAQDCLSRELRSSVYPTGAYDVLRREGRVDVIPTLQTTHSGIALTRIYEDARQTIDKAVHTDAATLNGFGFSSTDNNSLLQSARASLPKS